jgi:hypothetical protein
MKATIFHTAHGSIITLRKFQFWALYKKHGEKRTCKLFQELSAQKCVAYPWSEKQAAILKKIGFTFDYVDLL